MLGAKPDRLSGKIKARAQERNISANHKGVAEANPLYVAATQGLKLQSLVR